MAQAFYTVELRNKNFDLIKILTKQIKKLSWEFDRIGGCGRCTIALPIDSESLQDLIDPDFDIQIKLPNKTNTNTNLVYRGYAETYKPTISKPDNILLQFFGYSGQLKRIRVNKTYTNEDVNDIIKDILNTFIVPDTSITFENTDISGPAFQIDTLELDTLADSAIRTVAELSGNVEWGVDINKNFYFKTRDDNVNHYVRLKTEIPNFNVLNDYSRIINKLVIKGGDINGTPFEETVNNTESQTNFGIRTQITSNSAIVSSSVAQQYGSSILSSKAIINRRGRVKLVNNREFFEETIPLGKISILRESSIQVKKYGDAEAIYGQFVYGGVSNFIIENIRYELASEGINVNMTLGQSRPDIYNEIKRLEFEIDQLR